MMIELAPPDKAPAWLVMWGCLCSDVQPAAADLPEKCPGHGRERVAKPEQVDALTEFVGVHQCGEQKCPVAS